MRKRNYILTIWNNAECYNKIEELLQSESKCNYYYIYHEREPEEEAPHIHLILEYENAREWESVFNKWKGAHIDPCINIIRACQYLTHKNDKQKIQYKTDQVKTNNQKLYEHYYNESGGNDYAILDEAQVFADIESQECRDLIDFYRKYGRKQTYEFRTMILDILKSKPLHDSVREKAKEIKELQIQQEKDQNTILDLMEIAYENI